MQNTGDIDGIPSPSECCPTVIHFWKQEYKQLAADTVFFHFFIEAVFLHELKTVCQISDLLSRMSGAVMSMFSLQNSMLHTFGGADDNKFRLIMKTVTGGSVLVIVLGIASFMIISGTKKLKRCEDLQ